MHLLLSDRQDMIVSNCGEIKSGDDWGYYDNDISNDELPPFPDDWEQKTYDFTVMLPKKTAHQSVGFPIPFIFIILQ